MTQIADRHRRLSTNFVDVVASVPPDRWSAQSPCDEWTARDVVRHVVGVHGMMLKPLGRQLSEAPPVDTDPIGALDSAIADVQQVLNDPALAGTEYDGYFGRTSVQDTIDRFLCFDLVIHAWDLAKAAGLETSIPAEEVTRVRSDADRLGDAMRAPKVVGPEVAAPANASSQDRLLAFLGRDPNWPG
jgi:uncharacterized protein (TIGR03086 family)